MMAASEQPERQRKPLQPSERFFQHFQREVTDIQEQITRISTCSSTGGERADAIDHCLASIARLSNEVKDASSYLPAYDQRTYGEAIKLLSTKLQEIRSAVAPRQKFAFKSSSGGRASMFTAKKNESAISLTDAAELANQRRRSGPAGGLQDVSNESSFATTPAEQRSPVIEPETSTQKAGTSDPDLARIRQPSFYQSTSVAIGNHDGLHIILPSSTRHATSSGTLSMLHRCVVDMSVPTSTGRPFAGLTLKNINESLIICGHVNGAAHLTNVAKSVIVVASRQFRMHESRDCDVYLLTTSRPIIEDCARIRFAPLPEVYRSEEDAELENQWRNVDDFKWLRSEPSPHWSILEEEERVKEGLWKDVVPGGPQLGTEEILKALGIPVLNPV